MPDRAEMIAERLVTTDESKHVVLIGSEDVVGHLPSERAEHVCNRIRSAIAAAIREAVAETLRAGLRECPVSQERIELLLVCAESDGRGPQSTGGDWQDDAKEMAVVIRHQSATIAALITDDDSGKYELGLAHGRAEGAVIRECLRKAVHGGCTWHKGSDMVEAEHALGEI